MLSLFDRPPRQGTPVLWGALLCLIWGTTYAVIRIGLGETPPFLAVACRFTVASALLLSLAKVLRLPALRGHASLWLVAAHAVFTFCIAYGVTYWAEVRIPSGLAALIYTTYPLLVALIAHFVIPGEHLTRLSVLGLALGFSGIFLIFVQDFGAFGGPSALVGATVMLLSPLASAVGSVLVKRFGRKLHPISLNGVAMAACAVVMTGLSALVEDPLAVRFSAVAVGAVLYLAILGSVVAFTIYFWLLQHVRAVSLSLTAYVIPVVALGVGALLFSEPVTGLSVVGGTLVLGGVAIATR